MKRISLCQLVLIILASLPISAWGQYETQLESGQVPFQSYDTNSIDSVDLQSGGLSIRIPLVTYPQVGGVLKLSYVLEYDSKTAFAAHICPPPAGGPCDYVWGPPGTNISCCNLHGSLNNPPLTIIADGFNGSTVVGYGSRCCLIKTITYENVGGTLSSFYSACNGGSCHTLANTDGTYRSTDATGISANPSTGEVIDNRGVQYFSPSTGVIARDPYGNTISISASGLQDTMGRLISAATATSDTSSCLATGANLTAYNWAPPGPSGGTLAFKICVATSSQTLQIAPSTSAATTTVTGPASESILLPDGRSWLFVFGGPAGELTQITLPTGGTITYTYQAIPNSSNSTGNWSHYISKRTVTDGAHSFSTTYGYNNNNATQRVTTVTSAVNDDAVHQFQCLTIPTGNNTCDGFYEVLVKHYKGSSLAPSPVVLRTESTTYNSSAVNFCVWQTPCVTQSINVTPATKTITLDDQITTNHSTFTYDSSFTIPGQISGPGGSYGDLTYQYDYDYTGSLLRETANTYLYASVPAYKTANMLDRVQSTTTYATVSGTLTQVAKTTYGYDEGMTGITGSNTSIQKWLNTTGTSLTTTFGYNSNGTQSQMIDPRLNQTTYVYSPTYSGYYLTEIEEPVVNGVAHNSYLGYDFNTGFVTSATDYNQQTTNYFYDAAGRVDEITYPDGGKFTLSYSAASSPLSITTTQSVTTSPAVNIVKTTVFDSLHRVSQTQLSSDPQGTVFVDTTYDSMGRLSTISNPYRSTTDMTYGVTTYTYDPLNRLISTLLPDNSTKVMKYANKCYTFIDEVGNQSKQCSDALGRGIGVWEAPNVGTLNYETDYSYDALNNLTGVTQKGNPSLGSARVRTFTYDSLSRIVCAANPEIQGVTCPASATGGYPAGAETYAYDANGNLTAKSSPAPNQSSPSNIVTVSKSYDALNRPTKVSYTGVNTATIQYGYDAFALSNCTSAPPGETDPYPVGFRTAMCDGSGATSWAHDQMGRIAQERRTIGTAAAAKFIDYTYNLDGSLAVVQTPPLKTIRYTYNGAGRQTQAVDSTDGINFVTAATYSPLGGLATMTMGSASGFGGIITNNVYNVRSEPILFSAGVNAQSPLFSECLDFHLGVAVNTAPCSFSASSLGDNGSVYQIVNNRDNTRSQAFTYDALNRIASGQSSGTQWGEVFTIDPWGNLTNRALASGKTTYEPLNAPAASSNHLSGFTYDAAGNMTMNGSASYIYDAENRIIAAGGFSYLYDGDGERVEKCTEGTTPGACASSGAVGTLYWRNTSEQTIDETDLTGNPQEEYIFFNGQRIARRDVSTNLIHYYFSDHLGSHAVVVNATATTCEQDIDYYPYGGVEHDYCPIVSQNYKFTGAERDSESLLDDMEARHYVSSLGRFMAPDPEQFDGFANPSDPQSWNGYAYARNNPLLFVDPSGLGHCIYTHQDTQQDADDDFDNGIGRSGGTAGKEFCENHGGTWKDDDSDVTATVNGDPDGPEQESGFFDDRNWVYANTNNKKRVVGCFLKGAAVGAATAVGVGLVAAGAVAVGVVSAPVASGVLLVVGAVGGAVAIYNGYTQARNGNWAGAAYSAGTIAGGVAGGAVVGGTVGDAINPPATRGFWSIGRDFANRYRPSLGSISKFLGTGPDTAAAAGASGLAGAGAATGAQGGCN